MLDLHWFDFTRSRVFECRFLHFFLVRVKLRWFVKILGHLSVRYALYKIFYNLIITTHKLFYWYNLSKSNFEAIGKCI